MEKIIVTEEIIWLAEKRIEDIPILKDSIRGKEANLIGSIGEVMFEKFIQEQGLMLEKENGEQEKYNHDYIVEGKFTVDVKTKERSVVPKDSYDCTVAQKTLDHQKPDYFYFVSLLKKKDVLVAEAKFTEAFMLGATDLPTFVREGEVWNEGDVDVRNGKRIRVDCRSIEICCLISNHEFIKILKSPIMF
jgi:hypothetical protein